MNSGRPVWRGVVVLLVGGVGLVLLAVGGCQHSTSSEKSKVPAVSREDGLAAWDKVYSVLTHPRCINCHTATNFPQQGDDRHRHFANVVRGEGGAGVAALQCSTCHQESNADSTGVPGAHGWHLAPLSMKWQDEQGNTFSKTELCKALIDRTKNGNLDSAGLLKHHTQEALVRWAFAPGVGIDGRARTLPTLTHEQFVEATRKWIAAGMPCP
jgi:mono/diheme cytochrome c family protein